MWWILRDSTLSLHQQIDQSCKSKHDTFSPWIQWEASNRHCRMLWLYGRKRTHDRERNYYVTHYLGMKRSTIVVAGWLWLMVGRWTLANQQTRPLTGVADLTSHAISMPVPHVSSRQSSRLSMEMSRKSASFPTSWILDAT